MSNHFTGLSLGPPLGDQRLDLCDLYAFTAPADPDHTVLILNANPRADALHPNAVYRLTVDNDGDLRNDSAFSFVFSEPRDARQTVDVFLASGRDYRLAFLTRGECPPSGLSPHTDTLTQFPYLGPPHPQTA